MATVKVTTDIDAPLENVFALFTDLEGGSKRVSGIRGIQMLTPGGFELGTRWIETRDVLGVSDNAEMEVTAYEKNRGYTVTHRKAGVRIDTEFAFEPADRGTRVSLEFGLNPQGLPPGLLSPLEWAISGKVREVLSTDLADLKESVERMARN
jgi:hypothetical protein